MTQRNVTEGLPELLNLVNGHCCFAIVRAENWLNLSQPQVDYSLQALLVKPWACFHVGIWPVNWHESDWVFLEVGSLICKWIYFSIVAIVFSSCVTSNSDQFLLIRLIQRKNQTWNCNSQCHNFRENAFLFPRLRWFHETCTSRS